MDKIYYKFEKLKNDEIIGCGGSEIMVVSTLKKQITIENNEEADYAFFSEESSLIKMEEEMFAVFFPQDFHKPCLKIDKAAKVRKVVVKIKI